GEVHGPGLPALPAGRDETLLEGRALRRAEVPDRAACPGAQFPARPARSAPDPTAVGVWVAVAGKAEGAPLLRRAGNAVPQALPGSGPARRQHRRQPAPGAGDPARQRGLPDGLRRLAQAGAAVGSPWPLHRQRPQDQHPQLHRQGRGRRLGPHRKPPPGVLQGLQRGPQHPPGAGLDRDGQFAIGRSGGVVADPRPDPGPDVQRGLDHRVLQPV
ncbi:MAG: SSU ribosomal protein S4p (S9e) @ SSU ribosomal protein S4p (S9e), zinc-dependent, partial [uncultured Thermomicrobiales bacterium]